MLPIFNHDSRVPALHTSAGKGSEPNEFDQVAPINGGTPIAGSGVAPELAYQAHPTKVASGLGGFAAPVAALEATFVPV